MMEAPCSQRLILGTDQRKPLISLYEDDRQTRLHVCCGFELREVVPQERDAPAFMLLVGRLYNAGVKACALSAMFEGDRKAMQRWGWALRGGDAQELVRVLAGRQVVVGAEARPHETARTGDGLQVEGLSSGSSCFKATPLPPDGSAAAGRWYRSTRPARRSRSRGA